MTILEAYCPLDIRGMRKLMCGQRSKCKQHSPCTTPVTACCCEFKSDNESIFERRIEDKMFN